MWSIPFTGCINLKERLDRFNQANHVFSRVAKYVDINVKWYQPDRDSDGGEAGCFRSHMALIRQAYDSGAEYAWINEDDLEPTEYIEYFSEIQSFIERESIVDNKSGPVSIKTIDTSVDTASNHKFHNTLLSKVPEWDIVYLGGLPNIFNRRTQEVYKKEHCSIYKGACILAHSYFISRRYMEKIKDMDYMGIPIDRLHEQALNAYFVYLPLFRQAVSPTSIEGHNFANSKMKNFWIEAQQWYATSVNYPINPIIYSMLIAIIIGAILIFLFPKLIFIWITVIIVLTILLTFLIGAYYE